MAEPVETAPEISWSGLLRAVAMVCLLVSVANAAFAVLLAVFPMNKGSQIISAKFALAEGFDGEVDWLFLGDSSCNQSLRPEVFERATGDTALNLCTIGNLLVAGDAWMLDRWLETHAPPKKGIVMMHVYDVWPRTEEKLKGNAWVVPGGPAWRLSRDPAPGDWREVAEATGGAWLPLYTQSTTVATLVRRPWSLRHSLRPSFGPRGFMLGAKASPKSVRRDVGGHLRALAATPLLQPTIAPVNLAALRRVKATVETHGLELVVLLAPTAESLAGETSFRERLRVLETALIAEVGVDALRFEPTVYPDAVMENADHLDEQAATRHTEHVARTIALGRAPR